MARLQNPVTLLVSSGRLNKRASKIETHIQWELTDTFSGEANYSWVRRGSIPAGSKEFTNLAAIRRVKKALGWNGLRCKTSDFGDMIEIKPSGMCQVCFINFHSFGRDS